LAARLAARAANSLAALAALGGTLTVTYDVRSLTITIQYNKYNNNTIKSIYNAHKVAEQTDFSVIVN